MSKKSSNSFQGFGFLLFLLLIWFVFFKNNLYAQQIDYPQQNLPPTIILKDGAKLFSIDQSFNHQVLNDKIILKNSNISYKKNKSEEYLLKVAAKQLTENENLNHQLKIAEVQKKKEAKKNVKKEIQKFEKRVHSFIKYDFNSSPSPDQFFSSKTIAKIFLVPTQINQDFSGFYLSNNFSIITQALDFLHSQNYTYYNNKSLNFCFSNVYSVRPPPQFST